jgi:hypothetical protein
MTQITTVLMLSMTILVVALAYFVMDIPVTVNRIKLDYLPK